MPSEITLEFRRRDLSEELFGASYGIFSGIALEVPPDIHPGVYEGVIFKVYSSLWGLCRSNHLDYFNTFFHFGGLVFGNSFSEFL